MTHAAFLHRQTDRAQSVWLRLGVVGGIAVAAGSLSVVLTSAFYVASPPDVIAPVLAPRPDAVTAALAGEATMRIAGTSGVFGNLVMAVGCLLFAIARVQAGHALQAAGWAAIVMSIVVFEIVDALTGFVLSRAAADPAVFFAFRNLYAVFFLVGTALFGVGAVLALWGGGGERLMDRLIVRAGIFNGAIGVLAVLATFVGLPFSLIVGATVGLGAAIFVAVGARIAADSLQSAHGF